MGNEKKSCRDAQDRLHQIMRRIIKRCDRRNEKTLTIILELGHRISTLQPSTASLFAKPHGKNKGALDQNMSAIVDIFVSNIPAGQRRRREDDRNQTPHNHPLLHTMQLAASGRVDGAGNPADLRF